MRKRTFRSSPYILPSTTMRIASGILQKYPLYSCLVSASSKYSTMFFILFPILSLWLPFCKIDFRALEIHGAPPKGAARAGSMAKAPSGRSGRQGLCIEESFPERTSIRGPSFRAPRSTPIAAPTGRTEGTNPLAPRYSGAQDGNCAPL